MTFSDAVYYVFFTIILILSHQFFPLDDLGWAVLYGGIVLILWKRKDDD